MQRLIVMIAATMLCASVAYAQSEEGTAEGQAAAPAESEASAAAVPGGMDPEKFWPDRNDPDKYKESIRWGVTPVLDQIDADHSLGLKQHD